MSRVLWICVCGLCIGVFILISLIFLPLVLVDKLFENRFECDWCGSRRFGSVVVHSVPSGERKRLCSCCVKCLCKWASD
jgi:hypothetical protein